MGRDATLNPGSRTFGGPPTILDARNRSLQEGDEILLTGKGALYFRVVGITPVLDPAAPPGLLHLHVACMTSFVAQQGQLNREFVRVRTAEEAGALPFSLLDAQEQGGGAGG